MIKLAVDFGTVAGSVGGSAGFLGAVLYGGKQLIDWLDRRREGELQKDQLEVASHTATVTDAATANALILKTLEAVHGENERLRAENSQLKEAEELKDARIVELQVELGKMADRIRVLYDDLERLRTGNGTENGHHAG